MTVATVDVSRYQSFSSITERLDQIVAQVRDKDVSLERSLDLFDEAIALGSKAVELVDATDFTPEEEERLAEAEAAQAEVEAASQGEPASDPATPAPDGTDSVPDPSDPTEPAPAPAPDGAR